MAPREQETETTASEQRVDDLLHQLTLAEKVSLLSGRDHWRTTPVERLGIPSIVFTDGPHGVRANRAVSERLTGPTTAFPTGASMAATWNPALIERVGRALGDETRALGCDVILGPCINIVRTPLGGRNFETFSEDPYLAGRIGVAYVQGVQSRGVGTSVKHYVCNNQETRRERANSRVDERTLREIYLAAFETVVKEARPWTVMCSYNRIHGVHASQNRYLLTDVLKHEWGFEGVMVSDWNANHTTVESIHAGLDLEMPGPPKWYGKLLLEALRHWQVDETTVDAAARRVLCTIARSGKLSDAASPPAGSANTPAHRALAREVAEESITLLKNERDALPLDAGSVEMIAVIGPNAVGFQVGGGGSSYVEPPYRVSPLESLRDKLEPGVTVRYEPGGDNFDLPPALAPEFLKPIAGESCGWWGEFFDTPDLTGEPQAARGYSRLDFRRLRLPEGIPPHSFSVRWSGTLVVPDGGRYLFNLAAAGGGRLYLDGELVLDIAPDLASPALSGASGHVELVGGRAYDLRVEYVKPVEARTPALHLRFAHAPQPDDRLERAVALAREADAAIVFAGGPYRYEMEGVDRPHMDLPGHQNALIAAVAGANARTIVVLNCASPVTMPWVDEVAAVLLAYLPGQEGANGIANILLGEANPSGRLPVTFPKRYEDNPTFINYPGDRDVLYGERVYVGYRYHDKKEIEPLFPFGHGLSYTAFAYSDLRVPQRVEAGDLVEVSLTVENVGRRAGREVVQVYVHDRASSLDRPPQELKEFAKVSLAPGESTRVRFTLDQRALSFYDPLQADWIAEPGAFEVRVGASSRDIRVRASFELGG